MKGKILLPAVLSLGLAGAANAGYVVDDYATLFPTLTNDNSYDGASLENVLADIDTGGSTVGLTYVGLESWMGIGATSILLEEVAGYSEANTFGWYDASSATTDEAKASSELIFDGPVSGISGPAYITFTDPTDFGFYLGRDGDLDGDDSPYYFTQDSLNLGGYEQALVFEVQGVKNEYLIAFEDLSIPVNGHSDYDYQDLIVRVKIDVPEPGTLALFGLGLAGLGFARRRQQKN